MQSVLRLLTVLACAILLLVACATPGSPAPTLAPASGQPAAPTQAPPTAFPKALPPTPPGAQMPTAVPIWTPTPLPAALPPAPPATGAAPGAAPTNPTPAKGPAASLDPSLVARINNDTITRAEYELQAAEAQLYLLQQPGLNAATPAGKEEIQVLRQRVLGWMIDQVLIEQAAAARGITVSQRQIEDQVAVMRGKDATRFNQWLAANGMTMDQLRAQIRLDLLTAAVDAQVTGSLARIAPQVRVRHLLVSQEAMAQEALQRIRAGEPFVVVARRYSEDSATRESGGELGFIPRGVMPEPFDEVAFSLPPGQVSDVVRTESGLHIIEVIEVDAARQISDELWPVVQQNAFERWLDAQRAAADIVVADVSLP